MNSDLSWRLLATSGDLGSELATFGDILATSGDLGSELATFGDLWRPRI